MPNPKELSRQNWNVEGSTIENINAGSLQRIADATEAMAKNYVAMQNDLDYYKRMYRTHTDEIARLNRSRAALQAWVTRLRNKLAAGGAK